MTLKSSLRRLVEITSMGSSQTIQHNRKHGGRLMFQHGTPLRVPNDKVLSRFGGKILPMIAQREILCTKCQHVLDNWHRVEIGSISNFRHHTKFSELEMAVQGGCVLCSIFRDHLESGILPDVDLHKSNSKSLREGVNVYYDYDERDAHCNRKARYASLVLVLHPTKIPRRYSIRGNFPDRTRDFSTITAVPARHRGKNL
jgi:hypothetical protein